MKLYRRLFLLLSLNGSSLKHLHVTSRLPTDDCASLLFPHDNKLAACEHSLTLSRMSMEEGRGSFEANAEWWSQCMMLAGMPCHVSFYFPARYRLAYQIGSLELSFVTRCAPFSPISCLLTRCQSGWATLMSENVSRNDVNRSRRWETVTFRYIFTMSVQVYNMKMCLACKGLDDTLI